MMKKIRIVTIALLLILAFSNVASAASFSDMPTDPAAKQVIENAVKNGLLAGSDGLVRPDDYITRAEMAAIITRACGATKEGDISKFTDVKEDSWYYSAIAKAYEMGALSGTKNSMSPENLITFQECFTVLSQVFDLVPKNTIKFSEADITENKMVVDGILYDFSVLTDYNDGLSVADWAKVYFAGVVESGGWNGVDNNLTPSANITRLQFATVMDNLFKNYIDTPGTYNSMPEGNILVRCDGAVLENFTTDSDIYIADCVSPNGITIKNVTCNGRIVIRGCATPKFDENLGMTFGECGITISGHFDKVRVIRPYIKLDMRGATYDSVYAVRYTSIDRIKQIRLQNSVQQ